MINDAYLGAKSALKCNSNSFCIHKYKIWSQMNLIMAAMTFGNVTLMQET